MGYGEEIEKKKQGHNAGCYEVSRSHCGGVGTQVQGE